MENKKYVSFCFLILHYMNIEMTHKTVQSILNLHDFGNSQIIIVDNASPNNSGKVLIEKYKNIGQIHIVLSSHNMGFSAGNNIGFQYIKDNFYPEFVIALNNDVLFTQKEFIKKVKNLYAEAPFWVAGPDIVIPQRKYHSSPISDKLLNSKEIESIMKKWEWEKKKLSKKFSLRGFELYIRDCYADNGFVKNIFRLKRMLRGQNRKYQKRSEQVILQGSCLIFDKRYCKANEKLFLPITFMYAEEDILTWQCIKNNWVIRYFPELQVLHMSEGSMQLSGLSYRQYCNKRMTKLKRQQEAYQIYMNQIQ